MPDETPQTDRPVVHTTTTGEGGRPVVFLHGLFGQGRNFTAAAKALAPDFSATLVDLPDHGRSAWSREFSYASMADAVARTIEQGPGAQGPVDLVGHSMGGKVAMLVALRHPQLVRRLVVVDIPPATTSARSEFRHLVDSMLALDLTGITRRSEADRRLAEQVRHPGVRAFLLQSLRQDGDTWAWQSNLQLVSDSLEAIMGWPADQIAGAVYDGPVLWVAGERSPYVQPEHLPAMRALFPSVLQVTIKGAGHWVHSEQPEAFTSALRTFLTAPDRA